MRAPKAKRPTRRATSAAEAAVNAPAPETPAAVDDGVEVPAGLEIAEEQTPFGRVFSIQSGDTTYSETLDPAKPDVKALKARLLARVTVA